MCRSHSKAAPNQSHSNGTGQRTRTEVLATFLRNPDIPSSKLFQQPPEPISVTLNMKAENSPELWEQTHYPTR